jgi:predicted ester cyclase
MYAENNKAVCRRFIQKIFNEGDLSSVWEFVSSDAVNHELAEALGEPAEGESVEWLTVLVYLYRRAFPDLHLEILDQIAERDRVVTRLRIRGTQKNPLMSIGASGRAIDVTGIRVDRFADGKIAESWFHLDTLGMLRQLDALPALNREPQQGSPAFQQAAPVTAWASAA